MGTLPAWGALWRHPDCHPSIEVVREKRKNGWWEVLSKPAVNIGNRKLTGQSVKLLFNPQVNLLSSVQRGLSTTRQVPLLHCIVYPATNRTQIEIWSGVKCSTLHSRMFTQGLPFRRTPEIGGPGKGAILAFPFSRTVS